MTEQRFPAGPEPRVRVGRVRGDLRAEVWDEEAILVSADGRLHELSQDGDDLLIDGAEGDLSLRLPARAALAVGQVEGDLDAEGLRRVELDRVGGDVRAAAVGELQLAGKIAGDLRVSAAAALGGRGTVGGDVALDGVPQATLGRVGGDLRAEGAASLSAEQIGGDVDVEGLSDRLTISSVGGDVQIEAAGGASVAVGSVGGELQVEGGPLSSLQVGSIGGDAELEDGCEQLNLGHVGGDLSAGDIAGATLGDVGGDLSARAVASLTVGSVGGDLELAAASGRVEAANVSGDVEIGSLAGDLELGRVGGDLELRASLPATARARARVGGDATVTLAGEPSLTITALVAGEVRGASSASGHGRKRISLRYGAGDAALDLIVGGDLRIGGAPRPASSSSSSGGESPAGAEFAADWAEFGREMGEIGRELGRLGREIGEEIRAALAGAGVEPGAAWGEQAARKMEEAARKVEAKARKMEEEAARKAEATSRAADDPRRVRIKINEREWQLDPERLERIKEQARRAAAEGISGAMEAVERALGRVRVPPVPPAPGAPPAPAAPPAPGRPPATGQTIKIELGPPAQAPAAAPPDLERERETILRMIAEGRLSPEEGDLLLEALGS